MSTGGGAVTIADAARFRRWEEAVAWACCWQTMTIRTTC